MDTRTRRVIVIGSGGREHALCRKLSENCEVYCVPGNAGIGSASEIVDLPLETADDFEKLSAFIKQKSIELTVIGPEKYLEMGLADFLESKGHTVFGTRAEASKLESSKLFAKKFMQDYNIPTGHYQAFDDMDKLRAELKNADYPVVLKADSLAAGKGVVIPSSYEEAVDQIDFLRSFGDTIILEEYLKGTEASIMCFVDGKNIAVMPPAQDYKRAFDGDRGPNTGGMGCYSPARVPDWLMKVFYKQVAKPFMVGIQMSGIDFRGVLFVGIMYGENGLNVLEFNTRFGDPETEVTLPRLKNPLVDVLASVAKGQLQPEKLVWSTTKTVLVVMASKGYPGSYKKGMPIEITAAAERNLIHFGTSIGKSGYETSGGRVLGALGMGGSLEEARHAAYDIVRGVKFEGMHFRADICKKD